MHGQQLGVSAPVGAVVAATSACTATSSGVTRSATRCPAWTRAAGTECSEALRGNQAVLADPAQVPAG